MAPLNYSYRICLKGSYITRMMDGSNQYDAFKWLRGDLENRYWHRRGAGTWTLLTPSESRPCTALEVRVLADVK